VTTPIDELIRPHLDALEADPGDASALDALERPLRQAGRLPDLLALLERQARLAGSPGGAAASA